MNKVFVLILYCGSHGIGVAKLIVLTFIVHIRFELKKSFVILQCIITQRVIQ